jgi:hypothetical protein
MKPMSEGSDYKIYTRRFLLVSSACGFAASIFAYVASFSLSLMELDFRLGTLLILGLMALFLPMYVHGSPASRSPTFFLTGFARGMPSWVVPCAGLLSLVGVAHPAWFIVHAPGAPEILDGQYVLDSRGHILKVLTEPEYLSLKRAELRMLGSMIASRYFVPMMCWWYRRNECPVK